MGNKGQFRDRFCDIRQKGYFIHDIKRWIFAVATDHIMQWKKNIATNNVSQSFQQIFLRSETVDKKYNHFY